MLNRLALAFACILPAHLALACGGPVAAAFPFRLAGFERVVDNPEPPGAGVRISFLGHASFLIETAGNVTAVTDYNGVMVPGFPPDIATMNHAHSTHFTDHPDPRIPHVLRGWRDDGGPAQIDLTVGDMHVTNLPTNIRDWGSGATVMYGNSIFVFAADGLCIAHLSHLHHELTADDVASLGPVDVVMAPVDNFLTLTHAELATVIDALHPAVVIPMHMFGRGDVAHFASVMQGRYTLVHNPTPTLTLTRDTLPASPEIIELPVAPH